jgi:hypothetical protein
MATVPGTLMPLESLSVNVSSVPAWAELIEVGSIGSEKVALTAEPDTTLSPLLVLVGTFVAPSLGLAKLTMELAAGAGDGLALPPPSLPPHPAAIALNSMAISKGGALDWILKLFIFDYLLV